MPILRETPGTSGTLVLMAGMDLPVRVVREQIRSAVHLIVQQQDWRMDHGKVISITEVTGHGRGHSYVQELFRFPVRTI